MKFNNFHLLQIQKVAGWNLSENNWRLLADNYLRKKLQFCNYTKMKNLACIFHVF